MPAHVDSGNTRMRWQWSPASISILQSLGIRLDRSQMNMHLSSSHVCLILNVTCLIYSCFFRAERNERLVKYTSCSRSA